MQSRGEPYEPGILRRDGGGALRGRRRFTDTHQRAGTGLPGPRDHVMDIALKLFAGKVDVAVRKGHPHAPTGQQSG